MTTSNSKTPKRKTRKKPKRTAPATDPDLSLPTFVPDETDPTVVRIGRPPLDLDPAQIYRIAQCHGTYEEIAFIAGCSVDTLERRFADVIKLARMQEKVSLRRLQFGIAHGSLARFGDRRKLRGPNADMAKWLGKQHLGQREQIHVQNQEVAPIVETYIPDNGRGRVTSTGQLIYEGSELQPAIDDSDSDKTEGSDSTE